MIAGCFLGAAAIEAQPTPLDPVEFQVNTYTTNVQIARGLAVAANGTFVITWRSEGSSGNDTSGFSVQARRFRRDGTPLDPTDFQVNTLTGSHQQWPAVATDPDGGFVVVWESPECWVSPLTCINFRRFDPSGAPLDAEDVQANVYVTGSQQRPSAGVAPDGGFVLAWHSYGSFGSDNSGTSIQARRYRADGTPLDATEFQVNTFTSQFQRRPDVAVTPGGDFVVVWDGVFSAGDSYYGISARRFRADGTPLDPVDIPVNTYTTGRQARPSVAVTPGGEFVVVWQSEGSAGSDQDLYSVQARRFGADGVPLDPAEFQVNTYTTSYQYDPDVAVDLAGDFVVAWTSWGSHGNDQETASVQIRRFLKDGLPVDAADYQVNTLTSQAQSTPALGLGSDGDLVIAWSSEVSAGSDTNYASVQARRFGRPTIQVTTTSGGTGGPDCTLRDAVAAANLGAPVGGCPAGNEGAVIELPAGATIALATIDNGTNALPVVVRPVTIRGDGARIARDPGLACPLAPELRLFEVAANGILTLEDVSVSNGCLSSGAGAGVLSSGGTVILREASVEGNEAGLGGGGVAIEGGNLLAFDSTLRGNLAGGPGGGISVAGEPGWLLVERTTVSENGATSGGGLAFSGATPGLVRNSTFSGNQAVSSGGGIEVVPAGGAELLAEFTSVTNNEAPLGAGAHVGAGVLSLHGSLTGDNTSGEDCSAGAGAVDATGLNLDTDGSCAALAGGGFATVPSLGLGPLAENGGATRTHLPLAGSPALDSAPACATRSGAPLGADQRRYPRPTDDDGGGTAECELGAVERGPLFLDGFETGDARRWSFAAG